MFSSENFRRSQNFKKTWNKNFKVFFDTTFMEKHFWILRETGFSIPQEILSENFTISSKASNTSSKDDLHPHEAKNGTFLSKKEVYKNRYISKYTSRIFFKFYKN
jgi:hypothetical protein